MARTEPQEAWLWTPPRSTPQTRGGGSAPQGTAQGVAREGGVGSGQARTSRPREPQGLTHGDNVGKALPGKGAARQNEHWASFH